MDAAPDPHRLTDAQRDFAMSCYDLACLLAVRATRKNRRLADEIRGAAMVGLVASARTYDPSLGIRFTTWSGRVVLQHINHEVDFWRRPRRDRAREAGDPGWLLASSPAPPDAPDPPPPGAFLAACAAAPLTARESAVLSWCVLGGMTHAEAAGRLGVSVQTCKVDRRAALDKLRAFTGMTPFDPRG